MAEQCGTLNTLVEGYGTYSGLRKQKTYIQNIARQMALTEAQMKADMICNQVKCKFTCPVKTYRTEYLNRTETENYNSSTGIYNFSMIIRLKVIVKCSKILSVPMKKNIS